MADAVRTLAAESAIRALIARYGRLIDTGKSDEIGRYFGVLRVRGSEHVGSEAVSRFLSGARRGRHLTTDSEIEIDGARASAISSFVFLAVDESGKWHPSVVGRYHDSFEVRGDEWCFAVRDIVIEAAP